MKDREYILHDDLKTVIGGAKSRSGISCSKNIFWSWGIVVLGLFKEIVTNDCLCRPPFEYLAKFCNVR